MNNAGDLRASTATGADDATVFSLLRAAHALEDRLESTLAAVGLSSAKFSVLSELAAAGQPLALSELAARLSCVRSNMTQLVDRLEADGLVRRVDCPTDRRSVKAEITEAGTARQAAGAQAVAQLNQDLARAMPTEDRAALRRMLSALG